MAVMHLKTLKLGINTTTNSYAILVKLRIKRIVDCACGHEVSYENDKKLPLTFQTVNCSIEESLKHTEVFLKFFQVDLNNGKWADLYQDAKVLTHSIYTNLIMSRDVSDPNKSKFWKRNIFKHD